MNEAAERPDLRAYGFAPGNYACACHVGNCDIPEVRREFQGAKRSIACEDCALAMYNHVIAVEEQEKRHRAAEEAELDKAAQRYFDAAIVAHLVEPKAWIGEPCQPSLSQAERNRWRRFAYLSRPAE